MGPTSPDAEHSGTHHVTVDVIDDVTVTQLWVMARSVYIRTCLGVRYIERGETERWTLRDHLSLLSNHQPTFSLVIASPRRVSTSLLLVVYCKTFHALVGLLNYSRTGTINLRCSTREDRREPAHEYNSLCTINSFLVLRSSRRSNQKSIFWTTTQLNDHSKK